eukprot:jgi/Psemu1/283091/fgenesh1_pg.19_\
MPIDLKWVRTDPDRVREFQALRRRPRQRRRQRREVRVQGQVRVRDRTDDENENDSHLYRPVDPVGEVLRRDELARKQLQSLQEFKRSLGQLQIRLRPPKSKDTNKDKDNSEDKNKNKNKNKNNSETTSAEEDRQRLLDDKKALEATIKDAETTWKRLEREAHAALCRLASPDYTMRYFAHYSAGVELPPGMLVVAPPPPRPGSNTDSSSASGLGGLGLSPERAHELWGCCSDDALGLSPGEDGGETDDGATATAAAGSSLSSTTNCPICKVAAFGKDSHSYSHSHSHSSFSSPESPSNTDVSCPIVVLPSWIRLLTECLPNKSIWGERELPRYSALWGSDPSENTSTGTSVSASTGARVSTIASTRQHTHWLGRLAEDPLDSDFDGAGRSPTPAMSSLEIVALSAPSVVDAREIQAKLVDELAGFYESLLPAATSSKNSKPKLKPKLKRVVVPPPELHAHEWSRVELHLPLPLPLQSQTGNDDNDNDNETKDGCDVVRKTLRLGHVSHWGDAATRACGMAFAGGGIVRAGGKHKKKSGGGRGGGGGGGGTTKEYVHLIRASVIDDTTWNKILYANSSDSNSNSNLNTNLNSNSNSSTTTTTTGGGGLFVDLPPSLVPHLVRPLPGNPPRIALRDWIPGGSSGSSSGGACHKPNAKTKKTKDAVFGTIVVADDAKQKHKGGKSGGFLPLRNETETANDAVDASVEDAGARSNRPKFPPMAFPPSGDELRQQQRMRWEKLSCPYDFVFGGIASPIN